MQNPTDDQLRQLQFDWPGWQISQVHRVVGGIRWCARRHDDHERLLHADSPDNLAKYLEEAAQS